MSASCPSEDELVRLVEGALADASLASIEQHINGCERCAAVVAELGALRPAAARVVGRYQLDRRIAAGGMGEVWAAWDPTLRRDIAIKLVRPERADDGRERERLLREARALARLQHPNVLAVYDVGLADGDVFLATELVAGDTLANRGGATSDWRALARLYAQAARGLAAAHAAGLVHRDVKPANLLLGADGRVRVADFGLAVRAATPAPGIPDAASLDPQITASGFVAGTPAYMAPEQRLGLPADARADQFALCLALVEGIDGRRPTADPTPDALIAFVGARRTVEPALDALCRVLARGLAGVSDERFVDMTALADAIEHAASEAGDSRELRPAPAEIRATPREIAALAISRGEGTPRDSTNRSGGDGGVPRKTKPTLIAAGVAALALAGFVGWRVTRSNPEAGPATTTGARDPAIGSSRATAGTETQLTAPSGQPSTIVGIRTAEPAAPHAPSGSSPRGSSGATGRISNGTAMGGSPPSSANAPTATGGAPGSGAPAAGNVSVEAALEELGVAVRHRDARRCRDVVDALDPNALDHEQANSFEMLHARCEMIGGDCAGGARRAEALYKRATVASAVAMAVQIEADSFCPLTGDLDTIKRRLFAQTTHMLIDPSACRLYVAPARQVATAAANDMDKRVAGSVLVAIAKCFSSARKCDDAHALLREADALVPGLDNPGELTSACK